MTLITKKKIAVKEDKKSISPNNIICGDCLELLKYIRKSSVDLVATDPPYGIGYNNTWDLENNLNWEVLAKEFKRILKPNGSILLFQGWSNVSSTINILSKSFFLKNWIIYDRIKGRGAKTNLVSTREDILWFVHNEKNYTYNKISSNIKKKTGGTIGRKNGNEFRAMSNVWTDISPIVPWSKERVKHPTQKPLQLMDRIIHIFSNAGDVVLDCFAGSGTTIVSAISNQRKFIGFENNKDYFKIMEDRIRK